MALPRLGVDVGPLIAGLGVAGFIIGFAFQESLGNMAAGLMIVLNKPYQIGNYIEAAGSSGSVKELNMMATTLLTPDNKKIIIPNSKVWGDSITNYSAMPTRRVDMTVGISYGSDIGKAIETIKSIIDADDRILNDPGPMIEVVELGDSSVNLCVRPWCNTGDYWSVYFDTTRKMKESLDAAGIEIPFPQMDIHVQDLPKQA
jgi:small conductance mechanosensitive channel